jgi:hypothetical protein
MIDTIRKVLSSGKSNTDKIVVSKDLSKMPIWKYARCVDAQNKVVKNENQKIDKVCTILELVTGTPAFVFKTEYQIADVMLAFNQVNNILNQPLPNEPIESFVFSSITKEEESKRIAEAKQFKNILKRKNHLTEIEIDKNRNYQLVKTKHGTFQEFVLSEEINKKIFTDEARLAASDINGLISVLAYVYRIDGESIWVYDEKEGKYIFDNGLIQKRKEILKDLDIVTAWRAYNGFFLSANQY